MRALNGKQTQWSRFVQTLTLTLEGDPPFECRRALNS